MEHQTNFNHTLKSIVFVSSLLSANAVANESAQQSDKSEPATQVVLEKVESEEKKKLGTDAEVEQYKEQFERTRHFHEIKFSEDRTSYSLVGDKKSEASEEQKAIEVTEEDVFYIKHGYEQQDKKSHKKKRWYSKHEDDEDYEDRNDDDCWSFGKGSCNARDGFHYAFSFVSSGGDNAYDPSGEATDLNAYASYRIQIASLFFESPGMATRRIHGLYSGRAWGFNVYNTDQWRLDIYKQRDTRGVRDLEGIQIRNKDKRAGVRLTGFFDSSQLQMNVSPYSTSDQKDDGVAASLSYSHFWQVKNWSFYGSAGVQYQPKEVVSYYEEQPLTFDNRENRVNHDLEFGFEYPLSRKWVIGGFAAYSQTNLPSPGAAFIADASADKVNGFRSGLLLSIVL